MSESDNAIEARDAEILRMESCLAEERRAALAVRLELDQLRAAHETLLAKHRKPIWARLSGLFKGRPAGEK